MKAANTTLTDFAGHGFLTVPRNHVGTFRGGRKMIKLNYTNVYTFEIQQPGQDEWFPCHGQWETEIAASRAAMRFINWSVKEFEIFPATRIIPIYGFEYHDVKTPAQEKD